MGALTSTLVMGACYKVVLKLKTKFLSLTGISLLGAVTHNLTQIIFVYFFLINQKEIFYLLPWLGLSAVIMGWINGLIASRVCKNLADNIGIEATLKEEIANSNSFKYKSYIGGDSFIHDLKPEIKIVIAFFAGICILFTGNIYLYLFLLFFLFAGYVIAELSLVDYIKEISKMWLFLAASFLLPVFFNFTQDGLSAGTRFVLRIILLMSISSLLIKTTAPEKLAAGFKNILSPFQRLGISAHCAQRVGAIIALSWKSMPAVWDKINNLIHSQKVSLKRFPEIIQGLSTVIFLVYKESEK
ncbi:MAG: Gx transporter family protein [Elusimicrobiota bacterium]